LPEQPDGYDSFFRCEPARANEASEGTAGFKWRSPPHDDALEHTGAACPNQERDMDGVGGPDRDRTGDLMNAIHARSQLRYWPTLGEPSS
jgi:hypothetical protein